MRKISYIATLLLGVMLYPNADLLGQEPRTESPESPLLRREYEFQRTLDPSIGTLPENIFEREREFVKSIGVHDPFAFKGSPSEPLSTGWQYVGPKGQPGRMQALAIDIDNSKNILAGAATGGVWRSIDGGESWVKVTPVNEVQTVSCIVQDTRPGKHSIWYYGTSELLSTTDRPHTSNIRTHMGGNGIYRSIDNGATWDPLPSTQTRDGDTAAINFQGIWNIVIDHHTFDKDILYAACFGGIMRSINGGATWTKTLGSDTDMCFNSEITIGTNGTIYAALSSNYTGIPSPKQGIWWSNDGINWVRMLHTSIPTLWRRMKLAVAPSHDSILYIFAEGPKDWSIPDYTFASYHTLLKCGRRANGNIQWSDFSGKVLDLGEEPGQFSTLTGYAMVLAVHPYDSNFVLFGGTNLYRSFVGLFDEDLYHSIGGYPYDFEPGALHPDMHAALFDPSNPEKLFVATDGGIYSTDDPREDSTFWQQYYEGLGTSQVYDAKLDVTASGDDFIISGLQDNSSYVAFDHDAWAIASGGDGMTTGFADGKDLFVTSLQTGYMFFFGYDGISFYYYGIATINDEQSYFPFFTKFVIDHNTGNELYYASGQDLWVLPSLLSIPIDLQVDNGLWQQFQFVGESIGVENEISALALSTGSFPTLYMGTNNGMLFTIDAGEQSVFDVPKVITSPLFPSNGYLAHIEVDPHNESNIIVVFSNYGVQSIFSTTNGGTSWRPVSGNLEQTLDGSGAGPSVRTVRILHTPTGIVYLAGTTSGLFSTYTLDGMNTVWTREAVTTIGVLIVESIDVRESDGRVIAATQGGGIFSGNYQSLGTASVSVPRQLIIEQNYPNPVTDLTTIRYTLPESGNATLVLYDVLGKKIATLFEGTQEKGTHLFSFTPKSISTGISAGVYFYSLRCGGTTVTKMMEVVN